MSGSRPEPDVVTASAGMTAPGNSARSASAAGNGYDASASSGSNMGPLNDKLIEREKADADGRPCR